MNPLSYVLAALAAIGLGVAGFLWGRALERRREEAALEAGKASAQLIRERAEETERKARAEAEKIAADARRTARELEEEARRRATETDEAARARAKQTEAAGERKAEEIRGKAEAREAQARQEARMLRQKWEKEEARRRGVVEEAESVLRERTGVLDKTQKALEERQSRLDSRSETLKRRGEGLDAREKIIERRLEEATRQVEAAGEFSREEARAQVIAHVSEAARAEAREVARTIREEAVRGAERKAGEILVTAIQRMAAQETAQHTVSVVQLPNNEMKGRIIGREGRNIRVFEQTTGIDIVVDDTPEAVVLSGYDPVRREVARIALDKLVEDGRIHPTRIEEVVAESRGEIEDAMRQAAEAVVYELGVHNLHEEILAALGRMRYRTSYGQNQLEHSKEVALLAGLMAVEMGLDVRMARRAGLLHDIGKAVTTEHDRSHVELGYRLCKRHKEPDCVLNAIRAHHDDEPHRYLESWLVAAADAISGSRPGVRRDSLDQYVKRLEMLEEIATDHEGVERCFAVQAGRELRVVVEPDQVTDEGMAEISEAVARRIEQNLQYPGQIKVVVIREKREVNFAR